MNKRTLDFRSSSLLVLTISHVAYNRVRKDFVDLHYNNIARLYDSMVDRSYESHTRLKHQEDE
jgi:hypothetical protein